MAHSNQIREFLLTDHGVELMDVYVGPEGVLTGSMRLAQEAREQAAALSRAAGDRAPRSANWSASGRPWRPRWPPSAASSRRRRRSSKLLIAQEQAAADRLRRGPRRDGPQPQGGRAGRDPRQPVRVKPTTHGGRK